MIEPDPAIWLAYEDPDVQLTEARREAARQGTLSSRRNSPAEIGHAWAAHGLRRSRRLLLAKGFTGAAVLTLAVGIGATTAMFALVEGVLLRPLPVADQDRLVVVWKSLPTGAAHWPFRAAEIDLLRRESHVLESVAGISYYDPSPVADGRERRREQRHRRRGHR